MGALYRDLVRKHSKAKGSARAVLNIIADYATDEGKAWPGRAVLASDTGMSERNVIRCIQKLCEDGRLVVEENAVGGRGKVPVYKIVFPDDEKGDNLSPYSDAKRVTNAQQKGDKLSLKGDKSVANYSHVRSEPQEPQKEPGETPARIESPREAAGKELRYKSPHLDPRHFVNGYVPTGMGKTAVEVYYERFSINQDAARLSPVKEDDLVHFCKDLGKLREVVTAYSRTTYQPGNLQLILDWYSGGIPEKHRPPPTNGVHKNGSGGEVSRDVLLARARLARENIKTAKLVGAEIDARDLRAIEAAKGLT